MIAYAARPTAAVTSVPLLTPSGEDARTLALGYLRYASACWRGDATASVFATRLGAYWRSNLPPMPTTIPDAVSPHGGGGRGIHWYQTGSEVFGYMPGCRGGYQVPLNAIPRLVRCAPISPRTPQDGFDGDVRTLARRGSASGTLR